MLVVQEETIQRNKRTSLAAQCLRLLASNVRIQSMVRELGDVGLIAGQGTKISHAMRCNIKKKKKRMQRWEGINSFRNSEHFGVIL